MALVSIFAMLAGAIVLVSRAQQGQTGGVRVDELGRVEARVAQLELQVGELPDIYERAVGRAEDASEQAAKRLRSARAAESRARRAQGGDGGDDDPDEEQRILQLHAGPGEAEGLHPVRDDVARDPPDDLTQRAIAAGWTPFI